MDVQKTNLYQSKIHILRLLIIVLGKIVTTFSDKNISYRLLIFSTK
jgi:hypothetical protein